MANLADFPELGRLLGRAPAGSFVEELLQFRAKGNPVPVLDELELRLASLQAAGWAPAQIGTHGALGGDEVKFFSGVAEVVGLAWLATRRLLRAVGFTMPLGESVKGTAQVLDAVLKSGRSADVLSDIKSVQAQFDSYLRRICEGTNEELARLGHGHLRLHLHRRGAPDVIHARENFEAIRAKAIAAIPSMLSGGDAVIWHQAGLRLRGSIGKGQVQSALSSMDGDILEQQRLLWSRCHQLSMRRPFLLILVRTAGMGIETGALGDLLERALVRDSGHGRTMPFFGSTSTDLAPKAGRPKAEVQRYLSAVLFIDELIWGKESVRLYVNRHAAHPLPKRLCAELKASVTDSRPRRAQRSVRRASRG
jgi:hypothetical protein